MVMCTRLHQLPRAPIALSTREDPDENRSLASFRVSSEAIEWGGPLDETPRVTSGMA
jgi:hypothetical protein